MKTHNRPHPWDRFCPLYCDNFGLFLAYNTGSGVSGYCLSVCHLSLCSQNINVSLIILYLNINYKSEYLSILCPDINYHFSRESLTQLCPVRVVSVSDSVKECLVEWAGCICDVPFPLSDSEINTELADVSRSV